MLFSPPSIHHAYYFIINENIVLIIIKSPTLPVSDHKDTLLFHYSKSREQNFGIFRRKIGEKSFIGQPRKEKAMENSSGRKIGQKSVLSAIFRRKIGTRRFFHRKIGRLLHALEGASTERNCGDFSARN